MKVAGAVVLYQPENSMVDHIDTYIADLDILYVVDNSDKKNNTYIRGLSKFPNIKYLDNHGNKGMGVALNRAAHYAIRDGCHWLFTIDQDSKASNGMMQGMKHFIERYDNGKLGIATPYQLRRYEKRAQFKSEWRDVLEVMTSGNFVNLEAYKAVGGFDNKFYVDYTDFDFCLRLVEDGYKVLINNNALLIHNLGDGKDRGNIWFLNRNKIRLYYEVRNRLFLLNKYKERYPVWFKKNKKELLFHVLSELILGDSKFNKAFSVLRGYLDYKIGRFGKY